MIKTIVFNGGLGNQMFQYAFYLETRRRHPFSLYLFDVSKSQSCHNGYELDTVFQINTYDKIRNNSFLQHRFLKINNLFQNIIQENSLKFEETYLKKRGCFVKYEGFWQSEKYFIDSLDRVRSAFTFREEKINEKTKALQQYMKENKEKYISIHIRRGDYVLEKEDRGLCSIDYYKTAIKYIQDKVHHPTFVFFSDDLPWVKKNIHINNCIFVDWNHGNDSWQDMYLMSQCNHNIIANSSFSWWGAWLNSNKEKIVVSPKRWFLNSDNYDIIPGNWIRK